MPSHHDSRRRGHKKNNKSLGSKILSFFSKIAGDPEPANHSHHSRSRHFEDENGLREFLEGGERHRQDRERESLSRQQHHHRNSTYSQRRLHSNEAPVRLDSRKGRPDLTLHTSIPDPDMGLAQSFFHGVDAITPPAFKQHHNQQQSKTRPIQVKRKPVPVRKQPSLKKPEKLKLRDPDWDQYTDNGIDPNPSPRPNKRRSPPEAPKPGPFVKGHSRGKSNSSESGPSHHGVDSSLTGTTLATSNIDARVDLTPDKHRVGGVRNPVKNPKKTQPTIFERQHPMVKSQKATFHMQNADAHMTSMSLFLNSGRDTLHKTPGLPPLPGLPPTMPLPPIPAAKPRRVPGTSTTRRMLSPAPPDDTGPAVSNPFTTCVTCCRNPRMNHKQQCETCFRLNGGKVNKDAKFCPGSWWQQQQSSSSSSNSRSQRLDGPVPHVPERDRHGERLSGVPPHMPEHRVSDATPIGGIGHQDFAPATGIADVQHPLQQPTYNFNKNKRLPEASYEVLRPPTIPLKEPLRSNGSSKKGKEKKKRSSLRYSFPASTYADSDMSFACRGIDDEHQNATPPPPVPSLPTPDHPVSPISEWRDTPRDLSNVHPAFRHYYTGGPSNRIENDDDGYVSPVTEDWDSGTTAPTSTLPEPMARIGSSSGGGSGGGSGSYSYDTSAKNNNNTNNKRQKKNSPSATAAAAHHQQQQQHSPLVPHHLNIRNPNPTRTSSNNVNRSLALPPTTSSTLKSNTAPSSSYYYGGNNLSNNTNASVYVAYDEAFLAEEAAAKAERDKAYGNLLTAENLKKKQMTYDSSAVTTDSEYEDDMGTRFGGWNPEWVSRVVLPRREEEDREMGRPF